jgi:hypothetical protein
VKRSEHGDAPAKLTTRRAASRDRFLSATDVTASPLDIPGDYVFEFGFGGQMPIARCPTETPVYTGNHRCLIIS